MKVKTQIRVSPYGHSYMLGANHFHDEEYYRKTWFTIRCSNRWAAQSKARSDIWEVEFFDDDLNPIPCPCESCQHEFETETYSSAIFKFHTTRYCPKCHLKETECELNEA